MSVLDSVAPLLVMLVNLHHSILQDLPGIAAEPLLEGTNVLNLLLVAAVAKAVSKMLEQWVRCWDTFDDGVHLIVCEEAIGDLSAEDF